MEQYIKIIIIKNRIEKWKDEKIRQHNWQNTEEETRRSKRGSAHDTEEKHEEDHDIETKRDTLVTGCSSVLIQITKSPTAGGAVATPDACISRATRALSIRRVQYCEWGQKYIQNGTVQTIGVNRMHSANTDACNTANGVKNTDTIE